MENNKSRVIKEYFDSILMFGREVDKLNTDLFFNNRVIENNTNANIIKEIISKYKDIRKKVKFMFDNNITNELELRISNAKLTDIEIQILYYLIYEHFSAKNNYERSRAPFLNRIAVINNINIIDVYNMLGFHCGLISDKFVRGVINMNKVEFDINLWVIDLILKMNKKINKSRKKRNKVLIKVPKPNRIHKFLNRYIVGQDEAIKIFSAAVYKHYLITRINSRSKDKIRKSNILLIGPTGVGKTYMCKLVSEFINVPFVKVNATQYTETGYVGRDVEDMVETLYKSVDGDNNLARNGIIFVDEIDKIAAENSFYAHYSNRDVSGKSVQEEMLKLLEDANVDYARRDLFSSLKSYDISNVLFIGAGAFYGLERIIEERIKKKNKIGFVKDEKNENTSIVGNVMIEDLIEYGFLPEFIGRFGTVIVLKSLTLEDLRNIVYNSESSPLKNAVRILKEAKIRYEFSRDEVESIISKAYRNGTGARALHSLFESRLNEIIYENYGMDVSKS